MRFVRQSLVVGAVLVAYAAAQSALNARELASLPPTTKLPSTPLISLLTLVGFAVSLGAYGLLGRSVALAGGTPGEAAAAGGIAGLVVGALGVVAQAIFALDYARGLIASYGMPEWAANLALVATLLVAAPLGAAFGALVAWLASLLFGAGGAHDPEARRADRGGSSVRREGGETEA